MKANAHSGVKERKQAEQAAPQLHASILASRQGVPGSKSLFEKLPGSGLAAGRGGWRRCSSVTDCNEYAPSSRLAIRHAALAIPEPIPFQTGSYRK